MGVQEGCPGRAVYNQQLAVIRICSHGTAAAEEAWYHVGNGNLTTGNFWLQPLQRFGESDNPLLEVLEVDDAILLVRCGSGPVSMHDVCGLSLDVAWDLEVLQVDVLRKELLREFRPLVAVTQMAQPLQHPLWRPGQGAQIAAKADGASSRKTSSTARISRREQSVVPFKDVGPCHVVGHGVASEVESGSDHVLDAWMLEPDSEEEGEHRQAQAHQHGGAPERFQPQRDMGSPWPKILHSQHGRKWSYLRLSTTRGNVHQDMRGVCAQHGCTLTRGCRQNRPIGYIWAWLNYGADPHVTKDMHMAYKPDYQTRMEARTAFSLAAGAEEWFASEPPGVDEPQECC